MSGISHSSDRLAAVLAHIAGALADTADESTGGGRWTGRWDAVGLGQPHDPTTGTPFAGLNRLVLMAGAVAVKGASTGAWASEASWLSADTSVTSRQNGVIALRDDSDGLRTVTLFNACQVADAPAADQRFAAPPPFTVGQIDQLFGVHGGRPRTTMEEPDRRASHLSSAAVARAGARTGYNTEWDHPKGSLAGVLASQIVANTLGFSYCPPQPPPFAAAAWVEQLRSPTGGRFALDASADASRLAAIVVERIAARQIGALDPPACDRPVDTAFSQNGIS